MEVEYYQHIGIFNNGLDVSTCDFLIKYFEDNVDKSITREDEHAKIIESVSKNNGHNLNPNLGFGQKKDLALSLPVHNPKLGEEIAKKLLNNILPHYILKYMEPSLYNGLFLRDVKIQKTEPTEGYHIWHHESNYVYKDLLERVLAYTVYLNDVDEGGETEFLYQSKRIPPRKGTVVIFPAGYTHYHRGNPPLKGNKYIATGWICTKLPEE